MASATLCYHTALSGDNPRNVRAVKVNSAPVIDGFLNDLVWTLAIPAGDFLQRLPDEGKPATQRTEVRILYDDDAIYFGAMMYDNEPEKIVAQLARRDNEVESDVISFRFDTFHDHQNNYEFTINAAGVKTDIQQFNDGNDEDASWDVVWDVQTRVLSNGWSCEVKIPFQSLRYPQILPQEWGFEVIRMISRNQENDYWALIRLQQSGLTSHFGSLIGLDSLPMPVRLEVLPYLVGKRFMVQPTLEHSNGQYNEFSGGADIKYGLGSNFTLDATINPDFGQVEADPAVLNLTTIETFYPEKRPFFIEGNHILQFNTFGEGSGLYYSRRIGRAPTAEPAISTGGGLVSMPNSTTVLGAAKITGKTENGISVGLLQAMTKRMSAVVQDSSGRRYDEMVEPFSSYSVLRLRKDVLLNSNVGVIMTSVAREQGAPALTGGVDWTMRFLQNMYQVDGFLAFSKTMRTSDKSRIAGSAGRINFQKSGGEHWLGSLSADFTSPSYNVNDVGYFRRPNDHGVETEIEYKDEVPGDLLRSWNVESRVHFRWNYGAANINRDFSLDGYAEFLNYWWTNLSAEASFGFYDDRETRGNGLYRKPRAYSFRWEVGSDLRGSISGNFTTGLDIDDRGKRGYSVGVGMNIKPTTWMDFWIGAEPWFTNHRESWVKNLTDSAGTVTSIFADRTTDYINLTLRGTVIFTRTLTLQLYSQLFFSHGRFEDFRKLVTDDSFAPVTGSPNPDFTERSFALNAVLRWEYLPGSILYLVWTQSRSDALDSYLASFSHDATGIFGAPSDNVIALKVSYWLNM